MALRTSITPHTVTSMIQARPLLLVVLGLTALAGCGSDDAFNPGAYRRAQRGSLTGGPAVRDGGTKSGTGGSAGTSGGSGSGTGSNGTGSTPGPTGPAGVEQTCVDAINAHRAADGLPALQRWTAQEGCASTQAQSDSQSTRAHGAFGQCDEMAQNECPGWDGPEDPMIRDCLEMMWKEGPGGGHHDAMASREYTEVSCGFATKANGEIWSVQNFR